MLGHRISSCCGIEPSADGTDDGAGLAYTDAFWVEMLFAIALEETVRAE